ncbi:glycosyltransferase family 2 protein [candidate division KSB1 bacterium]|nr:glycosyltransferase family 2 protein [candidate division KSB1 bacterium]
MKNKSSENTPLVSIVIPMLNEVEAIERCVESIQQQDYPQDRLEIIVVDGRSIDGSREKVQSLAKKYSNIMLHDNPGRLTPKSLNIGIKNARGEVIIILGAHTRIEPRFVRLNIHYLKEKGVKCVGGTQLNTGETYLQRAIGLAMGSRFGIPSAPYRYYKKGRYVDTVVYAAYHRTLFDQVGYFDEELHISEDAEFNWRIRKAGHKIYFSPDIISYYYPRRNLFRLAKQFFNYGILRVNVIKKHFDAIKPMHLVPPVFVAGSFLLFLLGFQYKLCFAFLMLVWALYLLYVLLSSLKTVKDGKSFRYIFALPFAFMAMQLAWGLGFLVGIFKTHK